MRKLSKVFAGLALSTVVAFTPFSTSAAVAETPPAVAPLREPSECGQMFDVWTSGAGFTFVAYYGRDLPFSGSGTLKIWVNTPKWRNWGVSSYTPYDGKSLGRHANSWVTLELWKGGFMFCDGYYDSD